MANDIATWTAVVLALLCIVIALRNVAGMGKGLPLPPGPRRLPLIGNLLDMPTELEYLRFQSWSNTYGTPTHLVSPKRQILTLCLRSCNIPRGGGDEVTRPKYAGNRSRSPREAIREVFKSATYDDVDGRVSVLLLVC